MQSAIAAQLSEYSSTTASLESIITGTPSSVLEVTVNRHPANKQIFVV